MSHPSVITMSLPDGEYELDVLTLLDFSAIHDTENVAVRYGFIPDSMDQTKPIRLYQNDLECFLKASSAEGSGAAPVIFEGIPQRHRAGSAANESYYLTYNPRDDGRAVHLKRLKSTIRFSKSRNVSKLQSTLDRLERDNDKNTRPRKPLPKANKRPPTANNTPEIRREDPIISEADFDGLDEELRYDEASEFPDIIINDEPKPTKVATKVATKVEPKIEPKVEPKVEPKITALSKPRVAKQPEPLHPEPKKSVPRRKAAKSAPIVQKISDSQDMDDEFKDLEDQLQEVLEEEEYDDGPEPAPTNPKTSYNYDSDESDADDFQFSGIKINDDNYTQPRKTYDYKGDKKPMSLRDLVDGGKKLRVDDMSSSEEE